MRISDWSSDACSSDLPVPRLVPLYAADGQRLRPSDRGRYPGALSGPDPVAGRTVRGDAPPDGGCGTAPKAGGEGRSADQNCADRSYRNRRRRNLATAAGDHPRDRQEQRSEEHTSELQSLMRTSYDVICLKKK